MTSAVEMGAFALALLLLWWRSAEGEQRRPWILPVGALTIVALGYWGSLEMLFHASYVSVGLGVSQALTERRDARPLLLAAVLVGLFLGKPAGLSLPGWTGVIAAVAMSLPWLRRTCRRLDGAAGDARHGAE